MNTTIETNVVEATEIIIVRQLPIIEEKLRSLSSDIDQKITAALSLDCTEDTVKEVKKIRADLNKEFKILEEKRKEVKTAVMSPYEQFEAVYKEYVSNKFNSADIRLKEKIDEVESGLKEQKAEEIKTWFAEYAVSKKVEWLTFERAGINITLSVTKNALREQAQKLIDKVSDDIDLIKLNSKGEETEELIVEYKKTLDVLAASRTVGERKAAIEAEKARTEQAKFNAEAEQAAIEKVEQFAPPVESEVIEEETQVKPEAETEKIFEVKFVVRGSLSKLKELKQYLMEGGYDFGSIN